MGFDPFNLFTLSPAVPSTSTARPDPERSTSSPRPHDPVGSASAPSRTPRTLSFDRVNRVGTPPRRTRARPTAEPGKATSSRTRPAPVLGPLSSSRDSSPSRMRTRSRSRRRPSIEGRDDEEQGDLGTCPYCVGQRQEARDDRTADEGNLTARLADGWKVPVSKRERSPTRRLLASSWIVAQDRTGTRVGGGGGGSEDRPPLFDDDEEDEVARLVREAIEQDEDDEAEDEGRPGSGRSSISSTSSSSSSSVSSDGSSSLAPSWDDAAGDARTVSTSGTTVRSTDDSTMASSGRFSSSPPLAGTHGGSPLRKSSISSQRAAATSDPLMSPLPVAPTAPTLSFDERRTSSASAPSSVPSTGALSRSCPEAGLSPPRRRERGHWLPATPDKVPARTHQSETVPSLPDPPSTPSSPPLRGPLSSSPTSTLANSTVRRSVSLSSSFGRATRGPTPTPANSKPSLLSKSLRSLASLPNLNLLPNFLPQFPRPDAYLDSSSTSSSPGGFTGLKSGWGAKERRRVLDSEPSWDADEARGFVSRRTSSYGGLFPSFGTSPAASNPSDSFGIVPCSRAGRAREVVDEQDALVCSATQGRALDADLALSDFSPPPDPVPPPSSRSSTTNPLPCVAPAPTLAPPCDPSSPPPTSPPSPPPPPTQRYISNTYHLLMLSIEFSMMRADKISSPLRPRAVIVRTSSYHPPPSPAAARRDAVGQGRGRGRGRGEDEGGEVVVGIGPSGLRREIKVD
ncbi:hypothetical protein JCM10212_000688 [Sporobolomyces blumeae]